MTPTPIQYTDLLVTYLRPQWRRVVVLAVLLLISSTLPLVNPQIMRSFIDVASAGGPLEYLTGAALIALGTAVLGQLVYVLTSYLSVDVGWTATNALRADLTRHCLRLDLSFHAARRPGELMERVDGDATTLSNFFSQFVMRIVGNAALLAGVLALTFAADWRLGLLLGVFVTITLAVVKGLQGIGVPYFTAWRQAFADTAGFWEERLAGIEDIRTNGAIPYVMRLHYRATRGLMRAVRQAFVVGRIVTGAWEVLGAAGNAALFVLAAGLLSTGSLTIGTVYLVYSYAGLLATIIVQINGQLEDLQRAAAASARIRELYSRPTRVQAGSLTCPLGPLSVVFKQVSFGYAEGTPVIRDVSFTLTPGRVLGLLGRTGSGKTTLTQLIIRLYPAAAGAIRLNGIDIRAVRLDSLRQRVGYVTQEVQLFQATLRANLTFFDASIDDERLRQAIRELGWWDWFAALSEGLDTPLAAGGGNLSAGEAQLLALTRVFLRDPGLIILDEASSRLDPATERLIGAAIERLLKGRTGIIIAHNLATVARADEILILDAGRIREHGTYRDLAGDPASHFFSLLHHDTAEMTP